MNNEPNRDNTPVFVGVPYFDSKIRVNPETGCWEWSGTLYRAGYGDFHWKGKVRKLAHRFAYETLVGPIPDGLQLDHVCRNRRCVNPAHLEPVTARENLARSPIHNMNKTHCVNGHEFSPENMRLNPKTGQRVCIECGRTSSREFQRRLIAKKREATV